MEKFAVVSLPDEGERIINTHPILKRLPQKYAHMFLPHLPAQVTGIIMDTEENMELGYMLDVPGFFMDWDKLTGDERLRHINGIIRRLKDLRVYVLSFPQSHMYFTEEETALFSKYGISLLDGYYHRLAGLLMVLKQILVIVKPDLPYYEVGIWGADTEAGKVWVEALADHVNHMCIGGRNAKALNILADRVLKSTGLSCQITSNPEVCLNNKHIAAIAEPIDGDCRKCQPSFHFLLYREASGENKVYANETNIYQPDLGWMSMPDELKAGHRLDPWEELAVLDGLFYIISKVYREDILESRITTRQLERLQALYGLYPLKASGFIQNGRKIHFDRLRAEYFQGKRRGLSVPDAIETNNTLDKNILDNYNKT